MVAACSPLAPPLACAPPILHWHLRKCGGSAIRNAMMNHPNYTEAHGNYGEFLRKEKRRNAGSACGVRRIVILRHPYSQLRRAAPVRSSSG